MSRSDVLEQRRRHTLAFLRSIDGWVLAPDLAAFVGCSVDGVTRALLPALEAGEIERKHVQGGSGGSKLFWRLAQPKVEAQRFSTDWPPGFVPQFDSVKLPAYEAKVRS